MLVMPQSPATKKLRHQEFSFPEGEAASGVRLVLKPLKVASARRRRAGPNLGRSSTSRRITVALAVGSSGKKGSPRDFLPPRAASPRISRSFPCISPSPTAPPSPRPLALIAGLVLVGNPPSPIAGWLAAHSRGRLQQKENTESSLSWSRSRKQTRSLSTAAGRRSPLVSASPLAPCRIIGGDVVACIEQQW